MAATGVCLFPGRLPSVIRHEFTSSSSSSSGKSKFNPISIPSRRLAAVSTDHTPTILTTVNNQTGGSSGNDAHTTTTSAAAEKKRWPGQEDQEELDAEEEEQERLSLTDFFEQAKDFVTSNGGVVGPPRWFSPLHDGGSRLDNSPLLLFLPGIDGTGLGLIRHQHKLGKIFDVWCLHIPAKDRTSFTDLVKLVERTIRSEHHHSPNRPIYLVGESLGACLALSVAALNPDIDLVLILANPATSFGKSQLQPIIPVLQVIPDSLPISLPHILSSMTGVLVANLEKGLGLPLPQTVEKLSRDLAASTTYLSVLADILPRETLLWKLQMIRSASPYANSRLHAVKAQTLILSSGKDQLLPSQEEGERLQRTLANSEIRMFENSGHFLFSEDDFDLVTVIKGTGFYRHSRHRDYVSDYIPPTRSEVKNVVDSNRWLSIATSPVMLSTLADGKIVRSLAGVPSEGPVLFVGYHMLLGFELAPMVTQMLVERNIHLRGIAHPMMFTKLREGRLPDISNYDTLRVMGAVPVSGSNFYKLLSSKCHVLLYPGGVREALHRKGEEYKLFWPEQSEFVRMAARFGAKIVPFGAVGEDDIADLLLDYEDQMKIPFLKGFIEEITDEAAKVRVGYDGEVGNQDVHFPGIIPKVPGRFYYYFGKPIETQGRKQELRDREKAHQVYLEVKSEVEKCLAYLREKRENDPYRSIFSRLQYQAVHGFSSEVEIPTFEL
ncbi:PREDICTED: acyltransferase-like protein At3g26840, chloroplastic [Prunus mume]|uniref:Acyltransferase-like protein At3g26840, chloroplastic n=1 Tax=Prunus mume TaxID=102107 RepID=A0ABM0NWY6_PRUMU|nr:PREDICTED: acyltransferase-like protein At3g26840, chloroplastic [Prunus mume]